MKNLTDQKLLILGGVRLSCEIVKQAKQLGIYTSVTDYYEHSPAKRIADKSFMVSTTDVDGVVALIEKEKIDGVLIGFIDSMLPFYQKICEGTGLACYGTQEQFAITTNKARFKQLCRDFSIPVVEEFQMLDPPTQRELERLPYPVLIKPADYSGSRGVFICETPRELSINYQKSRFLSESNKVLIERLMSAEEVTIFYLIQDGNFHLSAMADRQLNRSQTGVVPLPSAYIFPSKHLNAYQSHLNEKVIEMFKSIGMNNGMIFIQSFVVDGNCIFYEMGYRLTGSLEYKIISKLNGINPMEMMIRFALTGEMYEHPIAPFINPNFSQWGCNLTFIAKPGKIAKIEGIEKTKALSGVIDVVPNYDEGDIIPTKARGTLQQVVLRAFASAPSKQGLTDIMDQIHQSIKVYSEDGLNLLLDVFDTGIIRLEY